MLVPEGIGEASVETRARVSPAWIVNAKVAVALVVSALVIGAAQQLPALPFDLRVQGERVVTFDAAQRTALEVTRIRAAGIAPLVLSPSYCSSAAGADLLACATARAGAATSSTRERWQPPGSSRAASAINP